MPLHSWMIATRATVTVWDDGRIVFNLSGGNALGREGRLDDETLSQLLSVAVQGFVGQQSCVSVDAAPGGVDFPSFTVAALVDGKLRTAVSRGLGAQFLPPESDLAPTVDWITAVYDDILNALPTDTHRFRPAAYMAHLRPIDEAALGSMGDLRPWPPELEGRLVIDAADQARRLVSPLGQGPFVSSGVANWVTVLPELPYLADPGCVVGNRQTSPHLLPLTSDNVRERVVRALQRDGLVTRFTEESTGTDESYFNEYRSGWLDLANRRSYMRGSGIAGFSYETIFASGQRSTRTNDRGDAGLAEQAMPSLAGSSAIQLPSLRSMIQRWQRCSRLA